MTPEQKLNQLSRKDFRDAKRAPLNSKRRREKETEGDRIREQRRALKKSVDEKQ